MFFFVFEGQTPNTRFSTNSPGIRSPKDDQLHALRQHMTKSDDEGTIFIHTLRMGESRGSMPAPPCLFMELEFHGSLLRDNPYYGFTREIIGQYIGQPTHPGKTYPTRA